MKYLTIPHSECDYFMVLEETDEFALITIKGFEFIVMGELKFIEDIKTGNLHEVILKVEGEDRSLNYVSHVSSTEYIAEKDKIKSLSNELEYYLKSLNISLN